MHGFSVFQWLAFILNDFLCLVSVQWHLFAHMREGLSRRLFENMVLRGIFGLKRDEVKGEWRKLHNEVLNDLYCSPDIVWVIRTRRMSWAQNVARLAER